MGNKVKLGSLLSLLTDYHANGAYTKLKENVELLDDPDYAVMIRTTNFEQECFHSNLKYISEHAYHFLAKSKVYTGDIIMNKIANAGSSYLMPKLDSPVSLAMNLFLLRVDEKKANSTFVYLFLKLNEAYVKSFANGSVTKTITKDAVRNLEIELPDRLTQNYIVDVYMEYTNKITLNRQINQTLEQMAQTLFKSWFVDFDPVIDNALDAIANGQNIEVPESLAKRFEARKTVRESEGFEPLPADIRQLFPCEFEESELGFVPKGWGYKPAQDIASISIGKTPPRKETEWFSDVKAKNVTWISIRDMGNSGVFTQESNEYLVPEAISKFNVKVIPKDSVILSFKMTLGRVSIASTELATNEAIAHFVNPKFGINKEYLYSYLMIFNYDSLGSTSSIATAVNSKLIKQLPVLVPDSSILDTYFDHVTGIFEKLQSVDCEVSTLINLRDTLLPKLISGELRLDSPQSEALQQAVSAE